MGALAPFPDVIYRDANFWKFAADAFLYHIESINAVNYLEKSLWFDWFVIYPDHQHVKLISLLYWVTGYHAPIVYAVIIGSVVWATSLILMYRSSEMLFPSSNKVPLITSLFFFQPSLLIHSTQLLRDPLFILGFSLMCYGMISVFKQTTKWKWIFILYAGIFLMLAMREYLLTIMIVITILFSVIVFFQKRSSYLPLLILIAPLIFFQFNSVNKYVPFSVVVEQIEYPVYHQTTATESLLPSTNSKDFRDGKSMQLTLDSDVFSNATITKKLAERRSNEANIKALDAEQLALEAFKQKELAEESAQRAAKLKEEAEEKAQEAEARAQEAAAQKDLSEAKAQEAEEKAKEAARQKAIAEKMAREAEESAQKAAKLQVEAEAKAKEAAKQKELADEILTNIKNDSQVPIYMSRILNSVPMLNSIAQRLSQLRFGLNHHGTYNRGSFVDLHINFENVSDMVVYFPRVLQLGFLSPFPSNWLNNGSQVGRIGSTLAGMEMTFLYIILVGCIYMLYKAPNWNFAYIISFFNFYRDNYFIRLYNIQILAAIYRMRQPYLIPFYLVGVQGLYLMLKNFNKN